MGQAQNPVSPTTQQLNAPTSTTATAIGTATFTFQSPPTGLTWTGTLSCAGAPASAIFIATVGATPWGDWAGNSVYGPVQCLSNQQLVVTATGLTPFTSYEMVWSGSSDAEGMVQPIWPDTNVSAQSVQFSAGTSLLSVAAAVSGTAYSFQVPVTVRTLNLLIIPKDATNLPTNVFVGNFTGAPAGVPVFYNEIPYLFQHDPLASVVVVPIAPFFLSNLATTAAEIIVTGTSVGGYSVQVFGDTAQYPESIFYNGVPTTATQVLAAGGSVTVLNGPARLLALDVTASGGASVSLQVAGNGLLNAPSGGYSPLTLPPNTLLAKGQSVVLIQSGAGATLGAALYAYP
jgi:hypothetical protein